MASKPKRPFVGIGVLVQKDGKYLLGKRVGEHGRNTWSVPGGHLEFGETFEDCAVREVLEETGVKIKNIKLLATVNNVFKNEHHHSITIFVVCDWASGEPRTIESDKFTDVGWYKLAEHPKPLFLPVQELKKSKPNLFKV
ncbi:NUDIX domain-containing protein [Candidatus Parcubacteria bacterium]|nr:NUDIX domain-containing protein [Candidatus Parcubacteria bacterium]